LVRTERGPAMLIPLQRHYNWTFKVETASQWHRESMCVAACTVSSADNTTTLKNALQILYDSPSYNM
jgi:hypothetical protein